MRFKHLINPVITGGIIALTLSEFIGYLFQDIPVSNWTILFVIMLTQFRTK
jgi:hypothetical protein